MISDLIGRMAKIRNFSVLCTAVILAIVTISQALDFRYVPFADLQESLQRFKENGVEKFSELLFDVPRYQIIVGARDYLFRLSLDGLKKLEEAHWPAPAETIKTCRRKGQSETDCRNYVKVLLSYNNKIFTCGTNAFSPECTWRDVNSLHQIVKWKGGFTPCPYNPHYNSTALMTSNGDYYIASALDFGAMDHAIYRATNSTSNLRTTQYDYKWLNAPDFVGSFEIGAYTYFFFREEAVEFNNCGKVIYSRVGRLCKNDRGGQYTLKDKWTTFLKARLNCSIPGPYPFYFNEIQGVHYLEQEQMIYATFNTPTNSIYGAAVCGFSLNSIVRAFNGPFKYQARPNSPWEKATVNHNHFQCEASGDQEVDIDAQKYQLMNDLVQPVNQQPVYTSELERFSHIAVDVVPTKHHDGVHVIFLATVEGVIRKLVVLPATSKTCLVEEIRLVPENSTINIHSIKLSKDMNSLYVGTDQEVMRIQTQRCKRFQSKMACLNAMDPYCGWHEHQLACTLSPNRNPKTSIWKQDLLTCPKIEFTTDGGWSHWSEWKECRQSDSPSSRCLCHTRTCTNPSPSNGGKPCSGETIEISNCTRNGMWTEWSSWSACSATCGTALKTRRRVCGNPSPAYGGRICIGPERDEIYCTSNPPCPSKVGPEKKALPEPIDGGFSEWSQWNSCSLPCGGGFQTRHRKCNNPSPNNGGRQCVGCSQDFRKCNNNKCPEVRKSTPWTPWLIVNSTRDGYFQQRHRFNFKVNVPDASMIRLSPAKKEERFCSEGASSCLDSAFVNNDGEWSEWQPWSKCSAPCDGGVQYRERICDNPRPSGSGANCQGEAKQEQECNLHSCQDDGWKQWSEWSSCDSNNEQHRQRTCSDDSLRPTSCKGANKEAQSCIVEQFENVAESKTVSEDGIHISHVISALLSGFIIGIIVTGVVSYIWYKRKGRQRNSFLTRNPAKMNYYENEHKKNNLSQDNSLKLPLNEFATTKRKPSLRTRTDDNFFG